MLLPVEYGIQRRSICLMPAKGDNLEWLFEQYNRDMVWRMFGMAGPGREIIEARHKAGELVLGITYRVSDWTRVGFVTVYPPNPVRKGWEVGQAIPDPAHRNAGHAQDVGDAIGHYMFDHLGVEMIALRVREDNPASMRVVEALGYKRYGTWPSRGFNFHYYSIDPEQWKARVATLAAQNPGEDVFFLGPDEVPTDVKSSCEDGAADAPEA